jgi:tetratricopeptide (TPR) repeat protein
MDERTRERLLRGREHYRANEYDLAEPFLSELAEGDGEYADVFDMLGVIYHQRGRVADALRMFERALAINPAYTDAALNLAVTYNDLGRYQEAKDLYERVVDASKNAPRRLDPYARGKLANMHADLGAAYRELGQYTDAVREYEKALALGPDFHDVRTRLGATLRDMGNLAAAAEQFERVRLDKPAYLPARLQLGLALYGLGRRADALDEWQQILALEPGHKSATMYVAMVTGQAAAAGAPPRSLPDGDETAKMVLELRASVAAEPPSRPLASVHPHAAGRAAAAGRVPGPRPGTGAGPKPAAGPRRTR